jgi:hypothetical protein
MQQVTVVFYYIHEMVENLQLHSTHGFIHCTPYLKIYDL